MYKHILVATDGSELSARAIVEAVKLAKCTGAKLTGFFAAPQYLPAYFPEGTIAIPGGMEAYISKEDYDKRVNAAAEGILNVVKREAAEAGVAVETKFENNDAPSKAILKTAEALKCDCIVMASHGRRGLEGLLLGSETVKVLTHGKLPLLVVR